MIDKYLNKVSVPEWLFTGLLPYTYLKGYNIDSNPFSDWLYGEYDEKKLRQFELLHNIPVVSNYMDYLLDRRADEEYLNRYGMDYSDVHDPRKLHSVNSGSRAIGAALNFVSSNVSKLYD